MQTVGELLKLRRQEKKWTLSDAERETKIRKKYLEALENNAFDQLPGNAYAVGFLKNYSGALNLDPLRILAIYRRGYDEKRTIKVLPQGFVHPVDRPVFSLTPRFIAVIAGCVLLAILFIYLLFEYRFAVGWPRLVIESPNKQTIVHDEKITIRGWADPDAKVSINGEQITTQVDGSFSQEVSLLLGSNKYTLTATSKLGKETNTTIVVERQEP